jgi:spore coat protein CotF
MEVAMNNNCISNSKVEVSDGLSLNDKDYMNILLNNLKEMVKNYAIAMTEASNETLYQEYKNMFDQYANLQRKVFELMFKNGWYALEKAEENKINSKWQTLNNELTNLQ